MKCKNCGKSINDNIKFCPYCGCNLNDGTEYRGLSEDNQKAEKLFKQGKYNDLLDMAISENMVAKGLYIQYAESEADKGMMKNYEYTLSELIKKSKCGEPFAMAAYGDFLYNVSKKGFLFNSDTNGMEKGASLVKRAASSDEPAALTIMSLWLMRGTEYAKDELKGYKYMKQAADICYPPAMYYLGYWHYKGTHNVTKNVNLGYDYIERAAFFGNKYARDMMTKENKKWSDDSNYSINDKMMSEIKKLISDNDDYVNDKNEYELMTSEENKVTSLIVQCNCVDDYIYAHQKIRSMKFSNYDSQYILSWIEKLAFDMYEIPPEIFKSEYDVPKLMKSIMRIAGQYTKLEQFKFLFEDLEKNNLKYDDMLKKYILKKVSGIINVNYCHELEKYEIYEEKSNLKGKLHTLVSSDYKKEMQQLKEVYRLITELIEYGYALNI